MRTFPTGATRNGDDDKLDYEGFLSPRVLERYAQYMHKHRKQADGVLRDSDNWQKGMPRAAYMKSLWRHFMDVWTQWRFCVNEKVTVRNHPAMQEALCAVLFNTMGLLHELLVGRDVGAEKSCSGGHSGVPCIRCGESPPRPETTGPEDPLRTAALALYEAGNWSLTGKPAVEQMVMWARLRDALGLSKGHFTNMQAEEKKPVRMDCPQWPKPPVLEVPERCKCCGKWNCSRP